MRTVRCVGESVCGVHYQSLQAVTLEVSSEGADSCLAELKSATLKSSRAETFAFQTTQFPQLLLLILLFIFSTCVQM